MMQTGVLPPSNHLGKRRREEDDGFSNTGNSPGNASRLPPAENPEKKLRSGTSTGTDRKEDSNKEQEREEDELTVDRSKCLADIKEELQCPMVCLMRVEYTLIRSCRRFLWSLLCSFGG
jgi:hypothetical protein